MSEYDERWTRRFEATQRRLALKEAAIEYLGGKCSICSYDRCPAALSFHHEDPDEKDFNISDKMSWEAIKAELDKCVLLCLNCHAETHAGYHPQFLVFEDDDRCYDPDDVLVF